MILNKDAFSTGQITSKLWLCKTLEDLSWESDETAVYAGWYGVLSFLLLSREKFNVGKIRSYDIDPKCQPIADNLNENWVYQNWKFKALTIDCNIVNAQSDLIINTATEHFTQNTWFENIPTGTRVILQGNNMQVPDHYNICNSLEDFVKKYPLSRILCAERKNFTYPTWFFDRYMLIGIK